jgi:hypothetical protein
MATSSRVELSRMHCTRVSGLWQVPNQGAVPIVGLAEMDLRRRSGNGILVKVIPSHKTRLKRQKAFSLTARMSVEASTAAK